jgi:acetyl-CoA carboxylase biotin carboxyl carrier protein
LVPPVEVDSDAVKVLADLLKENNLTEIEYQIDSLKIKVSRSSQSTVISPPSATNIANPNEPLSVSETLEIKSNKLEDHAGVIEAQMVGTVYLSPGPGTDRFISVGDTVSQGQTLFIIEAMKVMNMIKAPRSGTIKHIFVKDSQPVEYGDPIVILD